MGGQEHNEIEHPELTELVDVKEPVSMCGYLFTIKTTTTTTTTTTTKATTKKRSQQNFVEKCLDLMMSLNQMPEVEEGK